MKQILNYLEEQIKNLTLPDQEKFEYFEKIRKQNLDNSDGIKNISPEEMLICLSCTYNNSLDFRKTKQIYEEELKKINLHQSKLDDIAEIFYVLDGCSNVEYKEIKEFFFLLDSNRENYVTKSLFSLIYKVNKNIAEKIKAFSLIFKIDEISAAKIVKIIKCLGNKIDNIELLLEIIKFYENLKNPIRENWLEYLYIYAYTTKRADERYSILDKEYKECVKRLKKYCDSISREYKNLNRNYYKNLSLLNSLKSQIESTNEGEYISLSSDYFTRLPFEILKELVLKVNAYNEQIYLELEEKNKKNERFEINHLFVKYGFKNRFTKEEKEIVMAKRDIEDIEKYIDLLSPFINKEALTNQMLIMILSETTKEKINNVKRALFLEMINLEFVYQNPHIFLSPLNEIITKNIDLLKDYNCKAKYLNGFLLNQQLEKYLNLARVYQLNLQDKEVITNIVKPNFFDALDVFIEMGLYNHLINHPEILSLDLTLIAKRIKIAQKLGLKILDEEGNLLKSMKDGTNFCVPDDLLDQYIFNIVPLKITEENLIKLNNSERIEYESDDENKIELFYSIGDVKISAGKVLRNRKILPKEENFLDCIIFGSILNEEEYNQIYNEINARKLKKVN